MACGIKRIRARVFSRAPFGLPGTVAIIIHSCFTTQTGLAIAAMGVIDSEVAKRRCCRPVASFASKGLTASGVTSRTENPVPPVVIARLTPEDDHFVKTA